MHKHSIRTTPLFLAALAVLPLPAAAQQITATAVVVGGVKLVTSQGMHFGELDPTVASPANRVVSLLSVTPNTTTGNAGTLDYRVNRDGTQFDFTMPGTLTGPTATLAVDSWECGMEVGGSPNAVTDPGATGDLDEYDNGGSCASTFTVDLSLVAGARLVRLYIGGTILATAYEVAPAETFVGDITVGVTVP
jgi:hypothetical protein